MATLTKQERNKQALLYGLITGIIYLVVTTAVYMMVSNLMMFYVFKVAGFLVYVAVLAFFAVRIRKANGGYIEFRDLFGAMFIMVLIAGLLAYLYNYLYINVIDKNFLPNLKAATLAFMEERHMPEESLDDTAKKFDMQMAEAKTLNLKKNILTFCGSLVLDSLVGLLICLAVKKREPMVFNG